MREIVSSANFKKKLKKLETIFNSKSMPQKESMSMKAYCTGNSDPTQNGFISLIPMDRRRAQEADRMAKELEQAALHGGQRNHQLFEQVQEKTTAALQQAQAQINHESSVVKTLSQRNRFVSKYLWQILVIYFAGSLIT